jgi:fatty-acyl-CoA synthase
MRFLHTSDWHVGKTIRGHSRLDEHTAVLGEITELAAREQPAAIVYDAEFESLVREAGEGRKRFIAWRDHDERSEDPHLEALIAQGDPSDVEPPREKGGVVILTSGTTGSPKGAQRRQPASLEPAAALLRVIPLRARENTMLARRRCSTRGASRTSRSAWRSARRSSCAAASIPRRR